MEKNAKDPEYPCDLINILHSSSKSGATVRPVTPVGDQRIIATEATGHHVEEPIYRDGINLHYVYNRNTGDVTVKFDGVTGNVQEFDIISAGNKLIPANANPIFSTGFSTKSTSEVDALITSGSYTDGTDLGLILPTNLTHSQLTSDLTLSFSVPGCEFTAGEFRFARAGTDDVVVDWPCSRWVFGSSQALNEKVSRRFRKFCDNLTFPPTVAARRWATPT